MHGNGNCEPPAKHGLSCFALWIGAALCVVLIDQWTKEVVADRFDFGEFVRVTDFFNLCYLRNTGAAFSFLSDAGGWQAPLFIGLAFAVSVALVYWIYRECDKATTAFPLTLILGGALGNALDRILRGLLHWPAFNVADIAICSGAALLLFFELLYRPR